MTQIESEHISVKGEINKVFDFIRDLNHFHQLLPQDRISEWKSDRDSCSFKIQHTTIIDLFFKSSEGNTHIMLVSGKRSPFAFTLDIHLLQKGDEVEVFNVFRGQLNPLLKMMAEQALRNLFNYIARKVSEIQF